GACVNVDAGWPLKSSNTAPTLCPSRGIADNVCFPPIADAPPMWNVAGMPGRLILTFSAIVLFVAGGATLFAPDELARALDPSASRTLAVVIQLVGSGFLGFAVINW